MRHVLWALVGLALAVGFAIAAGRGLALNFRPVQVPDASLASRAPGLGWLLLAGLFLGLLVLSRRLSPVAPLAAGALLVVMTLVELAAPGVLVPRGQSPAGAAFGMYVLNGYGLGALFATLLLVVAATPGGRRKPSPG